MRFLKFISLVILLCATTLAWSMGNMPISMNNEDPLIGKSAPDISLAKSDGTSSSLSVAREGRKAILVFWATWCPHCRESLEIINDQLAAIEQNGIKILLVDVGETPEEIRAYLTHKKINMVSFIDEENALQGPYNLVGVPTLVFIDANGVVKNVSHDFPADYVNKF